ncbi:AMP-binding protein [Sphingopyxis terrae]|uniref:AMP-binding protein n=1 Tax=Sphingopyxis terrae TaxID=33052 RepID=UPI002A0BEAF8|nr:AMP-binding protein [Sphingopyxis terrae]MDX8356430.1 AMP-binding protein [Sphingopyxis terrae]
MARPTLQDPRLHPFAGQDLVSLLELQARRRGDRPFLIWEPTEGSSRTWSYAAFADETSRLAAGLAARGVGRGDRLIIHLENCPEFLLLWFACARIGAIAVTTNTRSSGDELGYVAENCGAVAAITQPSFADLLRSHCPTLRWIAVTDSDAGHAPAGAAPASADRFQRLYSDHGIERTNAPDPWMHHSVMYTSGTTSRPKGVLWTQGNALWGGRVGTFFEDLRPDDVSMVFLPLFHCNALVTQVLSAFWSGAAIVLQRRFSASRFWSVATRNRATVTSLVPFCIRAIADQPVPDHDFRLFIYGMNNSFDDQFGVRTLGWWGMTETVIPAISGSPNADDEHGTLGRPSPFMQIAITSEDGRPVEAGEIGNLGVRGIPGLSLFHSYLDMPELTEESFDEHGFFQTGDRCRLNEGGTISFSDRNKDMLKVGGENVAASEIERVILGVGGVVEVAVVGQRHAMLDEVPVAFVIAKEPTDPALREAITSACRATLADFKQPQEIRFVETLPRATLDKVAKAQLRAQLVAEGQVTAA